MEYDEVLLMTKVLRVLSRGIRKQQHASRLI